MQLVCQHCKHEWEYTGTRKYYATCPRCHYQVSIPAGAQQHAAPRPKAPLDTRSLVGSSRTEKGEKAINDAAAFLLAQGFENVRPSAVLDLEAEKDGATVRVEVKGINHASRTQPIALTRREFDYLLANRDTFVLVVRHNKDYLLLKRV